ncbi:hypothetical protein D9Q98_000495 [Chlorella vulgaris]|uniref:Uncharacterized protein n=1 Tax=Chlorella vulgaris TaxID=3077 RepID=A0A9D4Z1W7_CHLVU|nr:hypothetical protein D9Q98_000495 [Chlorella vulgaris]
MQLHELAMDPYQAWYGAMELWPAGLQSPTVYYMFKTRQMQLQIQAAAAAGRCAWRQTSASAGRRNRLLQQRNRPQLALHVPHASTGVEAADHVVYVRAVDVACSKPTLAAATLMAAVPTTHCQAADPAATYKPTAFTCESSLPLPSRLSTPPMQQEQRAKRSRLTDQLAQEQLAPAARPAAAAAPARPAHLIAPVPRRSAFLGLSTSFAAPPPAQAGTGDDPHGVMAWLSKMKSLLSPASRIEPAVY